MKLRTLLITIHRAIGILLGLVFLVIGLTGSTLVFHRELNALLNPHLTKVVAQERRIEPQVALDAVRSTFPTMELHGIIFPRTAEDVYVVMLQSRADEWIDVSVNPYTGALLGSQTWEHTLMSFLYTLHNSLLIKPIGDKFVGVCGVLLLVMVGSGLVILARSRSLNRGFGIRWQAPAPLVTYDLHKVGGFLSAAFLLLIASTGSAMVFSNEFESVAYWLTRTPKLAPPVSTLAINKDALPLQAILQTADAALPAGQTTILRFPHEADEAFLVQKKLAQDPDFYGRSKVYIDQYTGEVLRIDDVLKAPLAAQASNALLSLHSGTYGGLGVRWLYVFVGLTPPALLLTGALMWRNRIRARDNQRGFHQNT